MLRCIAMQCNLLHCSAIFNNSIQNNNVSHEAWTKNIFRLFFGWKCKLCVYVSWIFNKLERILRHSWCVFWSEICWKLFWLRVKEFIVILYQQKKPRFSRILVHKPTAQTDSAESCMPRPLSLFSAVIAKTKIDR